jgi:hypothetical protein
MRPKPLIPTFTDIISPVQTSGVNTKDIRRWVYRATRTYRSEIKSTGGKDRRRYL